jgi:hypothetical protein
MAEEKSYHLRGVQGKQHPVTGEVTRPGVKYLVVLQEDEGHEPVEYGHFANREDARLYQTNMAAQGVRGLKLVSAKNGKEE